MGQKLGRKKLDRQAKENAGKKKGGVTVKRKDHINADNKTSALDNQHSAVVQ